MREASDVLRMKNEDSVKPSGAGLVPGYHNWWPGGC